MFIKYPSWFSWKYIETKYIESIYMYEDISRGYDMTYHIKTGHYNVKITMYSGDVWCEVVGKNKKEATEFMQIVVDEMLKEGEEMFINIGSEENPEWIKKERIESLYRKRKDHGNAGSTWELVITMKTGVKHYVYFGDDIKYMDRYIYDLMKDLEIVC